MQNNVEPVFICGKQYKITRFLLYFKTAFICAYIGKNKAINPMFSATNGQFLVTKRAFISTKAKGGFFAQKFRKRKFEKPGILHFKTVGSAAALYLWLMGKLNQPVK